MGHALMENRNGLVVDTMVTITSGTVEREATVMMLNQIPGYSQITVDADKGYNCKEFVEDCRDLKATPHVARK